MTNFAIVCNIYVTRIGKARQFIYGGYGIIQVHDILKDHTDPEEVANHD
jgi:hypothetical protein